MRRALLRFGAQAIAAGLVAACSSRVAEEKTRSSDASATSFDAPPDVRTVTLTFWPFHELPMNDAGFEAVRPLGGVTVCVAKRRPHGASFDAFVDTKGPCITTGNSADAAAGKVVLPGVPGTSELVITAAKEGYTPAAFAVTTDAWDMDVTAVTGMEDAGFFALTPSGDGSALVPDSVTQVPDLGSLTVSTYDIEASSGYFAAATLGDAVISIDPAKGDGPFYTLGGKWIPGSSKTVAGGIPTSSSGVFPSIISIISGATFVNLPEGEYVVTVAQPNAFCGNPFGRASNAVYGYVASSGTLRAPVLAGHSTTVVAECGCIGSHDPRYCGLSGDGGVR
jgi:hypothetical protein